MRGDGKSDKRAYKVAVAVGAAIFAGGAIAIGAAASQGHSARARTAQVAVLSHGNPLPSAAPAPSHTPPKASPGKKPDKRPAAHKTKSGPNLPQAGVPAAWPAGNAAAGAPAAPRSANVASPWAAAPPRSAASHPAAVAPLAISGEVSCVSGHSVEGVWVQAARGSAFAPWRGLGNGSTSEWWFTLPRSEPYALHVGCGGTTASWEVADYSPTVSGAHNSFNCIDVRGESGYGTCRLR